MNDLIKIPTQYSLFDTVYRGETPVDQLFVENFNVIPSKHEDSTKRYSEEVISFLINDLGFRIFSQNLYYSKRFERNTKTYFLFSLSNHILISLTERYDANKEGRVEIVFHYDRDKIDIEDFIEKNGFNRFVVEVKKTGINLIKMEHGMLDTEEYELPLPQMDLSLNYGSEFVRLHEIIINRLNKPNDKGIILFHGDPGTGKTSYIRYLTHMVTEKEILFIPPSMAESISDPAIIPFLMDHKNSVLVIEDAERIIADREFNGSSAGVSNILNLTDGILGDCLNIQVVATFNMKREKIDQALLRKGRLIAEHKFSSLSVDETNKLLEYLNKTQRVDKGMVLSDIYNIDDEVIKTENKTKIGFNN